MTPAGKARRKARPREAAPGGRRLLRPAAVVLGLVVVAAAGIWWSKGRHESLPPEVAPPPVSRPAVPPHSGGAETLPVFQQLPGRWRRADGGYVLEIRSVEPGGKMDAAYFNPRPIHVERAEAVQEEAATMVLIVLRDVNYPGSTYTLGYDPATDRLVGNYFQAVQGQNFDVEFSRLALMEVE